MKKKISNLPTFSWWTIYLFGTDKKNFQCLMQKKNICWQKIGERMGNLQSAHKLVTSHLRLVAKIAMGYRGYGLPVNELISEGNIRFDASSKKI